MPQLRIINEDITINLMVTWNGVFMFTFLTAFIVCVFYLVYGENMNAVYAESRELKEK